MPDQSNNKQQKVTLYSVLLMTLTSVHHAYGAFVYHTPWRLHVLFLSVPVIILTLILNRITNNTWVLWVYRLLTLIIPIILIGIFEGLYNHVLKNILFFSGLSQNNMEMLYPSGTYEMPDNWFFEITGMLQGVIGIVLIIYFTRLNRKPI